MFYGISDAVIIAYIALFRNTFLLFFNIFILFYNAFMLQVPAPAALRQIFWLKMRQKA